MPKAPSTFMIDQYAIVIHPMANVKKALGVRSNATVWHWSKHYGLPIFHLPDGQVATTIGHLEQWARERRDAEMSEAPPEIKHGHGIAKHNYGVAHRMKMVA